MAKLKSFINILRRKIFFYIVWPLAFKLFSFKPIDEKLILFAFSKNYTSMPDNLTGLYEYLKDKGYNCKIMQAPQNAVKRILFDITFRCSIDNIAFMC